MKFPLLLLLLLLLLYYYYYYYYYYYETSHHTNIQYDQYRSTKHALKAIQTHHEDRVRNLLLSQGFVISSILKYSLSHTSSMWSRVQQKLPKNIFNFTIKYLNNTLTTRKKPSYMVSRPVTILLFLFTK